MNIWKMSSTCFQVIRTEMDKISFTKPSHKRVAEQSSSESSTVLVVPKKKCVSGPQDAPKLSSDILYKSLFEIVPNACLFTIIDQPKENDPVSVEQTDPVSVELTDPLSVEQTDPVSVEQTDPVSVEQSDPVSVEQTNPVSVEQSDLEHSDVVSGELSSTESVEPIHFQYH